jgi:hypothetical protein
MTSLLGTERTDFSRENRKLVAVTEIAVFALRVHYYSTREAYNKRVNSLDVHARLTRHRPHHRRKRAAPKLVHHVVVCIDARQFHCDEAPVDKPVVLVRILLLHRRAQRDLVSVSQDAKLSSDSAYPIDLCK